MTSREFCFAENILLCTKRILIKTKKFRWNKKIVEKLKLLAHAYKIEKCQILLSIIVNLQSKQLRNTLFMMMLLCLSLKLYTKVIVQIQNNCP